MTAQEWQKYTDRTNWTKFQNDIIHDRRADGFSLYRAIAYIVVHECGGDFSAAKRTRDRWARVASAALKMYNASIGAGVFSAATAADPASHYRLLRQLVACAAALNPTP